VALLLDRRENHYQQLLLREARAAAAKHGLHLLEVEFADGSSWTQVESLNRCLREGRPDALVILLAGEHWTRGPFERVVKADLPVVLLNRLPAWVDDVRRDHPASLVAGVTPRQEGIGEIQARQALRLAPPGSYVLLVTGDAASQAATARRDGLRRSIGSELRVHEIDGRWSAAAAEKALAEWFRIGADRDQRVELVVCHNDAMAAGVRAALARQAATSGRPDLARTPVIGCDGTDEEGKAMVARGELMATVVMPATTPAAFEILARHWATGATTGTLQLEAASHPPLESLSRR
jgi:ABC-type sugar transport system substrate-binding protein